MQVTVDVCGCTLLTCRSHLLLRPNQTGGVCTPRGVGNGGWNSLEVAAVRNQVRSCATPAACQLQLKLRLLLKMGITEQEKNVAHGRWAAFTRPSRRPRIHRCSKMLKSSFGGLLYGAAQNAIRCNRNNEKEVQILCCLHHFFPWNAGLLYNHLLTLPSSLRVQQRLGKPPSSQRGFPSLSDDTITKRRRSSLWAQSQDNRS